MKFSASVSFSWLYFGLGFRSWTDRKRPYGWYDFSLGPLDFTLYVTREEASHEPCCRKCGGPLSPELQELAAIEGDAACDRCLAPAPGEEESR